jgi:hypothetical protein
VVSVTIVHPGHGEINEQPEARVWCAGHNESPLEQVRCGRVSPGSPRIEGLLGETTLRDVLNRWEDRGLVDRDRLLGFLWVAPTVKALRLVGLDVRAWSFVIPQLAQGHAVGVVRLALEQASPPGAAGCRSGSCAAKPARAMSPTPPSSSPTTPMPPPGPGCTARTSTHSRSGSRSRSS